MNSNFISYLMVYALGAMTIPSIIGLVSIIRWAGKSKPKTEETEETEETTVIKKTA